MIKDVEKYKTHGMQYDSNFIENLKKYFNSKNIEEVLERQESQEKARKEFVKKFNINYIQNITIEDYVSKVSKNDRRDTFCYTLEQRLDGLGEIKGTPVNKFGVYYSAKRKKEECTKKYSKTGNIEEGFNNIKQTICNLIELGEKYNPNDENDKTIIEIEKNKIAPLFKGKILAVYYPEKFVNVFAPVDIDRFLQILNIKYDSKEIKGWEIKKKLLLDFKQKDANFSKYSNLFFTAFLYTYYRRKEENEEETPIYSDKERKILKKIPKEALKLAIDYRNIKEISDWSAKQKNTVAKTRNNKSTQKDIEKSEINRKIIGDEGEEAIVKYEKEKLKKWKSPHEKDVQKISQINPSAGYDIVSYNKDGNEIHIEVKTSLKPYMEFYITSNEYQKMQEDPAYRIYYLSKAKSDKFNLYIFEKGKLDEKFFEPSTYRVRAEIVNNHEQI